MLDSYLVVDVETTGISVKSEKIIEIGAVRVENHIVTGTYDRLLYPGKKLEDRIVELTGITDEELKDAPLFEEIKDEFLEFAGDLPLVGHQIVFDYSFLKKEYNNCGIPFERMGADTLRISRVCCPTLEKKTLVAMCTHFGISLKPHRAIEDAVATAQLYEELATQYASMEVYAKYFDAGFIKATKVKKQQKASKQQIERLEQIYEKLGIIPDVNLQLITRSDANRLYDRLVAQYGRDAIKER